MNFENMTTAELERLLGETTEKLASIKTQLDFAKSDAAAAGDFSDRDWFNRARHAVRMSGREHQLLMQELGKRRKAERRARNDALQHRFMEVARRRLDQGLFRELVAEAEAASV